MRPVQSPHVEKHDLKIGTLLMEKKVCSLSKNSYVSYKKNRYFNSIINIKPSDYKKKRLAQLQTPLSLMLYSVRVI